MTETVVEINGAQGEGGGQILRTALALSMVTGRPFHLNQIRANRPKPGLMRQHLACVQASKAICQAVVDGDTLNSTELHFRPGRVQPGSYEFQVSSAGSSLLVLQTVLPPLMVASAPSELSISGGTHNPMAPSFHAIERSFAPLLRRMGPEVTLRLPRMGFYPAGGGQVVATITPNRNLKVLDLMTRGPAVGRAYAEILAPGLKATVSRRETEALKELLCWSDEQLIRPPVRQSDGPGNVVIATLPFTEVTEVMESYGHKNRSSDEVVKGLVTQVQAYLNAQGALGPHIADQWSLPLAMAVASTGQSGRFTCTQVTQHTRTNLAVIEQFLPVVSKIEPWPSEGVGQGAAADDLVSISPRGEV